MTTAALLLATLFSFNARAQKVSDEDLNDIQKVYAAFTTAFEKQDAQAAASLYADNGIHIDPLGKIVRGRKDLLAYHVQLFKMFSEMPKADKTTHQDTDWNTRYLAPGMILVTYTSEDISYFGEKTRSDKFSMSVILKRTGNQWLAEEVTMTPVTDMPKS